MPRAKKTSSGKWRCVIYDYKDSAGRIHQKIFTAETKREAERMAIAYKEGPQLSDLVVGEAVKKYIDSKEPVISPATHRSYMSIYRNHYKETRFGAIRLVDLDNISIQRFISDLGVEAKTVSNIYGLLSATLKMFMPEKQFMITLPPHKQPELYTPTTEEVGSLVSLLKSTDRELYICVLLCAFGPMRRSEACAIRYDDIDRKTNAITVRRSRVQNADKKWVYKDTPKTDSSYRTIIYPSEVVTAIGLGFGYVINKSTPQALTCRLEHALKNAGLPHFRMHDLRHYGASILHTLMPDQYVLQRGGWKTDSCYKRIYRDTLSDVQVEMNQKAVDYFDKVLSK